jgi:hypothetical protein
MPFPVIKMQSERGNAYKESQQEVMDCKGKKVNSGTRKKEPPKKCPVGSDASPREPLCGHCFAGCSDWFGLLRAKVVMHRQQIDPAPSVLSSSRL